MFELIYVLMFLNYMCEYKNNVFVFYLALKQFIPILDLNFGELASGFALLKLPKMPELRNKKITDFEPSDIDATAIPYR